MTNGDMPANPIIGDAPNFSNFLEKIKGGNNYGLTKREMFAMAAMQGILSSSAGLGVLEAGFLESWSVNTADALLKALENTRSNGDG